MHHMMHAKMHGVMVVVFRWIVTRFGEAVYACEQISPLGAQQVGAMEVTRII